MTITKKAAKKTSYINEMKIDKIIADLLSRFHYTEEFVQDVLVAVKDIHEKNVNIIKIQQKV